METSPVGSFKTVIVVQIQGNGFKLTETGAQKIEKTRPEAKT